MRFAALLLVLEFTGQIEDLFQFIPAPVGEAEKVFVHDKSPEKTF
jgi:hypothetical protein